MSTTTKYFDAEAVIAGYEAQIGKKASAWLCELIRTMEPYFNDIYEAGYADGLEAAHG